MQCLATSACECTITKLGLGCRDKAEASKPSITAVDDVRPVQSGTEAEAAAAEAGTVSDSPIKISNDGDVLVSVEPAAIVQKLAEPEALSVEISDGHMDKADGSFEVDVTAAQTARAHQSKINAGTASGQQEGPRNDSLTAFQPPLPTVLADLDCDAHGTHGRLMTGSSGTTSSKVGGQPSKESNWLLGNDNQAGSGAGAGRASGNKASKSDEKAVESGPRGTGSEKDDSSVVPITVDRSLLS